MSAKRAKKFHSSIPWFPHYTIAIVTIISQSVPLVKNYYMSLTLKGFSIGIFIFCGDIPLDITPWWLCRTRTDQKPQAVWGTSRWETRCNIGSKFSERYQQPLKRFATYLIPSSHQLYTKLQYRNPSYIHIHTKLNLDTSITGTYVNISLLHLFTLLIFYK